MKEYWMNVYGNGNVEWLGGNLNIATNKLIDLHKYRLHVREFETREAKELYLKLKYGSVLAPKCEPKFIGFPLSDGRMI